MRLWAVVPAAGHGSRFGAIVPKQYLSLCGETVLTQTLRRLDRLACLGIAVGLAPDDPHWTVPRPMLQTPLSVFTGGAERAVTVLNGLRALAGMARADDLVAVHDAARPCVRHTDLLRVIAAATANNDGALLARPVAETVKRSDGGNRVDATADRRGLWLAQTPQVFRFAVLRAALERALAAAVSITDEASAIEYQGGHPELVMGSADNIKITLAEDLRLAALYLADRAEEAGNICA